MNAQLSMFDLMTLEGSCSAISLPALADGPSRPAWLDGLMTALSGRDLVPASPSVSRASRKALKTSATSGPSGATSSPSDVLQQSLENRLRERLTGSDLCEVIWKPWVTPWGQSLWKPRARVRITDGTASGLWPPPHANCHTGAGEHGTGGPNLQTVAQALWQTPVADDAVNRTKGKLNSRGEPKLSGQVMALWPTPTARDHKDGQYTPNVPVNALLGRTVWAGSSAPTEKPAGSLNPAFVCWLMGYAQEHLNCAPTETRSTSVRRPK